MALPLVTESSIKGSKAENQDAVFQFASPSQHVHVLAVFDGHGVNGKLAADTARDILANFLHHLPQIDRIPAERWGYNLAHLFQTMEHEIRAKFLQHVPGSYNEDGVVRKRDGTYVGGGTTATIIVSSQTANGSRFLVRANVGDSDAYLVSNTGQLLPLFVSHKATDPNEAARFRGMNVELVYSGAAVGNQPIYDHQGNVRDPTRLGVPGSNARMEPGTYVEHKIQPDKFALAMTRSLGDFYSKPFGVLCEPSVDVVLLNENVKDATIVVASDGVWDSWRYPEFAAQLVAWKNQGIANLADTLCRDSVQKSNDLFGPANRDDISAVVFRLPNEVRVFQGTKGSKKCKKSRTSRTSRKSRK